MTPEVSKTRAFVVGAGPVGGLFVQALSKAGWVMTMLARGVTLAAIRSNGLHIDDERIDVTATDDPRTASPQDY